MRTANEFGMTIRLIGRGVGERSGDSPLLFPTLPTINSCHPERQRRISKSGYDTLNYHILPPSTPSTLSTFQLLQPVQPFQRFNLAKVWSA